MNQVTQQNAATAEETASASEELSAQTEEMKSFVAGLAAMVDEKSAVSTGGHHTARRPKATGHARQAPKKALTIAKISTKGRALTLHRSREVNPDDIIPNG